MELAVLEEVPLLSAFGKHTSLARGAGDGAAMEAGIVTTAGTVTYPLVSRGMGLGVRPGLGLSLAAAVAPS